MKKSAKQIYKNGSNDQMTTDHVIEIVNNLYNKKIAEVWFIGLGWPEGYTYCQNQNYLRETAAPMLLKNNFRSVWFACRFLD